MRKLVIGLVCLVAAQAALIILDEDSERSTLRNALDFQAFVLKYNKPYRLGHPEYDYRLAVFSKNRALVDYLNANPNDLAEYSLDTPFADLSTEEFKNAYLLKDRAPADFEAAPEPWIQALSPPDSVDWNAKGAVTAVKDQGALGTCWAFSTIGTIEGQRAIHQQKLEDLSVEQLVECDAFADPKKQYADCGMFGGWPYLAYQYLLKAGGLFSNEKFPYSSDASDSHIYPCMAEGYNKDFCGDHSDLYCNATSTKGQGPNGLCKATDGFAVSLTSWRYVSKNETEIAQELAVNGPLSVALDAESLQFYSRGIFNPGSCDASSLDHAVLLTGYGSEGGKDYWIVKNSWGVSWGEKGFFRIKRGSGTCGINTEVTIAEISQSVS